MAPTITAARSEPAREPTIPPLAPAEAYLDAVYGRYLSTSYAHRNDLSAEGVARAARVLERELGPHLPGDRATPVLEIGCGNGGFLRLCRDRGYTDVRGLDISPELVAFCRRQGFERVERADGLGFLRATAEQFGLVVLIDMLEHLPKQTAVALMQAVRDRLLPGGRVLVRVPNMSNPLNLQARYGDFTHETGFSKESLEQLFRVSGLEVESVHGAAGRHRSPLARLVFDRLLWRAFLVFYRRTMQLKAGVERGKNLIGVALRPADPRP
jgi:SAM-dependent methyltransferase